MKKLFYLVFLMHFVIFIVSCAGESEYTAKLPKIDGYEVNNIYRLNRNILAAYTDLSGNRLLFKLNESSATWKRIMFKTKVFY